MRVANQGQRNANDGVSYLQVADGVTDEITNLLTRAAELAEQAASGTSGPDLGTGKTAIDAEYQNIIKSIDDLNTNTTFNGAAVYGSTLTVAVGGYSPVTLNVSKVDTTTLYGGAAKDLTTAANASAELANIKKAIDTLSGIRGGFGATQQQLTSLANSLGIQSENLTAASSQIRDANVADEVVNLNKFQILNQSGTSALSQANQAAQSVLKLLQ